MATTVFVWEGKTRQGSVQKGEIAANNKDEVMALLRKQNITPVNVSAKAREIKISFGEPKIIDKDIVILTRQLATMIDAGLPLVQCLEILGSQTPDADVPERGISPAPLDVPGLRLGRSPVAAPGIAEGAPREGRCGEGDVMWMSMTGFGRGERHGEEVSVSVDVRSVNHRFLDVHTRCPVRFLSWEPRLRGLVRDAVRRGKLDLHVNVREWGKLGGSLRVNRGLLSAFLDEAARIREVHGIGGDVTLRDLLAVPEIFQVAPEGAYPAEMLWPLAEGAARDALEMLRAAAVRRRGKALELAQQSSAFEINESDPAHNKEVDGRIAKVKKFLRGDVSEDEIVQAAVLAEENLFLTGKYIPRLLGALTAMETELKAIKGSGPTLAGSTAATTSKPVTKGKTFVERFMGESQEPTS